MHTKNWIFILLLLSGCATLGVMEWDKRYGKSSPTNREVHQPLTSEQVKAFIDNVQPIIENRCVVCHGCFDAPCQLKMESPAGIERGATTTQVYATRINAIEPSHFVTNHQPVSEWREKGFYPVLNERNQTAEANLDSSVFYKMLNLKRKHPLPKAPLLDDSFDLNLMRDQQCPTAESFAQYEKSTPLGGMPYGLPQLEKNEHDTLVNWLQKGALMPKEIILTNNEKDMVNTWETFLNQDSLKAKLSARYIYEHLYLANLHFTEKQDSYFTIVRSTTAPGEDVDPIVSRRPYDDPGVENVYYRLIKNIDTVVSKRHMPYLFDKKKLARFNDLFLNTEYAVTSLPSYELDLASNPFKTFAQLPAKSRYLFMLEEAQFSIMNFIKGPSCRGQVALGVIEDDFWVFFANPDLIENYSVNDFYVKHSDLLQMPASTSGILDWYRYSSRQQEFLEEKMKYRKKIGLRQEDIDLDLLWTGDGNKNAVLSVFRHFDSASVIKGAVGKQPKTSWVVSYPILERVHYLLVAGFDIYGGVTGQLKTRLYMDFLRIEGESNFIKLLPREMRESVYKHWYRDTNENIMDYLFSENMEVLPQTNIEYKTDDQQTELYSILLEYTKESLNHDYDLKNDINGYKLKRLSNLSGKNVAILPQLSYVMVNGKDTTNVYTLINNSGHSNVGHLFSEDDRRLKDEDNLEVVNGMLGSYPNAFFEVKQEELGEFIVGMENIHTNDDYFNFKSKYGVRRTDKNFWQYSDKLHQWYLTHQPEEYGLLDYNRLENR